MKGRIIVIGETGMLGQALIRAIGKQPKRGPMQAIIAAGLVGGITDNMARPVNYLRANLRIALDFLERCHSNKIERVVYVASSCMYPKDCRQPMRERDLWTGPLEPTNEGYAIAKLAGEALCRAYSKQYGVDFRTAILCNLYGPGDRGLQNPDKAHVIPALIHRFKAAKKSGEHIMHLAGNGMFRRELMHHDDAARGVLAYLAADEAPPTMNIGSGQEVTIAGLAVHLGIACGFVGPVVFDGIGGGMKRKLLDSRHIKRLGWKPKIPLLEGLKQTVMSL